MRMIWISLLAGVLTMGAHAQPMDIGQKAKRLQQIRTLAKQQVREIANYDDLSPQSQQFYQKRIEYYLNRLLRLEMEDGHGILNERIYDIYTGLVHIPGHKDQVNLVPHWGISYVPDINLYYLVYLKYYEYYLQYGEDTPLPEVLLAIMNVETHFRWLKGDNQQSIGPCQLHSHTARWLLSSPGSAERFRNFIYFDRANQQGEHHFYSKEAMVSFMYEFLLHEKNYKRHRELQAIATYNGSSVWGLYSRLVRKAMAGFVAHRRLFHNQPNQPGNYSAAHIARIKGNYYQRLFPKNQYGQIYLAYHYAVNEPLPKPVDEEPMTGKFRFMPVKDESPGLRTYLKKETDRSLFSYFRGNMPVAVFYHNKVMSEKLGTWPRYEEPLEKHFIYLYYTQDEKKHYIRNVEAFRKHAGNKKIQTNFSDGKIYLHPDLPVFYYNKTNRPVCYSE